VQAQPGKALSPYHNSLRCQNTDFRFQIFSQPSIFNSTTQTSHLIGNLLTTEILANYQNPVHQHTLCQKKRTLSYHSIETRQRLKCIFSPIMNFHHLNRKWMKGRVPSHLEKEYERERKNNQESSEKPLLVINSWEKDELGLNPKHILSVLLAGHISLNFHFPSFNTHPLIVNTIPAFRYNIKILRLSSPLLLLCSASSFWLVKVVVWRMMVTVGAQDSSNLLIE